MDRDLVLSIKTWALLLLLMPLIVTNGTIFPFIVGKALFARVVIEIAFGLWLILAFLYPSYRPRLSWLVVAFAIYLAVSLLAGIAGVSLTRSLWSTYARMQGIVDLAHWFLLLLVLPSVFRSMREWRLLFNANLGVSLVMALLGAAQHYDISFIPLFEFLKAGPRVDITLGNATFVGAYTLVNVFIGLALLSRSFLLQHTEKTRGLALWRLFWAIAITLNLWMLALSGTRGAYIGLSAGVAVFVVGYVMLGSSRSLKIALAGFLGVLVAAPLALFFAAQTPVLERVADSNLLVRRIVQSGLAEGSIRNRLACLSTGVSGFTDRPILGWGPENFVVAFGRHFDGNPSVSGICDHAHNKPLEELATKGILGFLGYSAIWALMLLVIIRSLRRREAGERLFTLSIAAALAGYFVQNLFLFDTPATFLQMMLLLAFVAYLEVTLKQPGAEDRLIKQGTSQDDRRKTVGGRASWVGRLLAYAVAITQKSKALGGEHTIFRTGIFGTRLQTAYIVIAVLLLVASGVYFLNYRPYRAATSLVHVINHSLTWEQRLGFFEQSIDSFDPLANYPRLVMFTMLTNNWDFLAGAEAERALTIVEEEARRAIDAEPQGWRLYTALARLYQKASGLNRDEAIGLARSYTDAANELAPKTREVSEALALQKSLEDSQSRPGALAQGSARSLLVVPAFLVMGIDELRYVWPDLDATQAENAR